MRHPPRPRASAPQVTGRTGLAGRVAGLGGRTVLSVWFVLPLVPVLLWAFAGRWSYPAPVPQRWGSSGWVTAANAGAGAAFGRSVLLGMVVAGLAVPAGALAARALALGRVRYPRAVAVVLLAPVALPPFAVVMGLDVLLLRAHIPAPVGVAVVLAVSALPYTTYTMRVAYGAYDIGFEEQARTLGARPATVLRTIHLPMLAPALAGAAFLAFLVGWSDYIVTILIGGGQFVTYPVLVASAVSGTGNEAAVAAMSIAALVPPLALLFGVTALRRNRRHGQRRPVDPLGGAV